MPKIPDRPISGEQIPEDYFGLENDFLRSLVLRGDGKTVRVSHTDNGTTISAINNNESDSSGFGDSSDSYTGYFKVIQTADNKIKIVDGFSDNPETENIAGDVLINNKSFNDIQAKEFTITADSFIYLISTEGLEEPNLPTLEIFSSKQVYELGQSKTLISRINFADEKITKFSQESYGFIIGYIDGDCLDSEEE